MMRRTPMLRGRAMKRTPFKRKTAPAGQNLEFDRVWLDEAATLAPRLKAIASVHSLANPMRACMSVVSTVWTARPPALRDEPRRSEVYRRWVADQPCVHCGIEGWSNACHGDMGKGLSIKACDSTCWPGCVDRPGVQGCHTLFGATGRMGREARRLLEAEYAERTRFMARYVGVYPAGWPS